MEARAGFSAPFLTDGKAPLWRLRGTADGPPWNAWRHRHGYSLSPAGYLWNTLDSVPDPLPRDLGERLDAHLGAAWKRWADPAPAAQAPPPGRLELGFRVPGPVSYGLSLWGAALEVTLELTPGRGDWLYDLSRAPRWTLDEEEWRRRHLYALGGPPAYDLLMRRCAAYWASATAHLLLHDLDAGLRSR